MAYPDLLKEYIECANLRDKYNSAPELLTIDNENITTILPIQTQIYADRKRKLAKIQLSNIRAIMDMDVGRIDIPSDPIKAIDLFSDIMINNISTNYGGSNAFMYMVEELIDNVYQHSGFHYGSVGTKLLTAVNAADLGVFDNGVTIRTKLHQAGMWFIQDSEAIVAAVNGLSSKSEPGRGFGLGTTVRLVVEGLGGQVFIASGSGAIYVSKNTKERYDFGRERLDGTLVTVRVPRPCPSVDVYDYI